MTNLINKPSIYNLTYADLKSFLKTQNQSLNLTDIIYDNLYKGGSKNSLSMNTKKLIENFYSFELPKVTNILKSEDGTVKFLIEFSDSSTVESVLIPFYKRYTICLSSQVGCAMKCSFCYTGTQGLKRHLKTFEIITQYLVVKNYLESNIDQNAISPNIVFMGQGEPLHNFEEVKKAINIFLDKKGLFLGPRQVTLSSAGFLPGLKRFHELLSINFALSLHSPIIEKRKKLIPITDQYPLEKIMLAIDQISLLKRQFITYEYLLIKNFNDSIDDADALQELLGHRKAIINIIPFNPFPGGSQFTRPSNIEAIAFKDLLVERQLRTMIRTTKGSDILAACGQLKSQPKSV